MQLLDELQHAKTLRNVERLAAERGVWREIGVVRPIGTKRFSRHCAPALGGASLSDFIGIRISQVQTLAFLSTLDGGLESAAPGKIALRQVEQQVEPLVGGRDLELGVATKVLRVGLAMKASTTSRSQRLTPFLLHVEALRSDCGGSNTVSSV